MPLLSLLASLALFQSYEPPAGFVPATEQECVALRNKWKFRSAEYYVRSKDGKIFAGLRSDEQWMKAWAEDRPPVKEVKEASLEIELADSKLKISPKQGFPAFDGYLIPIDRGEFGGGLFWVDAYAQRYETLSTFNTCNLAQIDGKIYAIQNLAHLSSFEGKLLMIDKQKGKWRLETVTEFKQPFWMFIQDGKRFITLNEKAVYSLNLKGQVRELYRFMEDTRIGNMLVLSNHEIWLGCDRTLLHLTPQRDDAYQAQWYIPENPKIR